MPPLSARVRAHLKSLAHPLAPLVQVGIEGVTPAVGRAATIALEQHELIKIRLGQGFEGEREEAAAELVKLTNSQLVQVIGRIVVLYRRRSKDDPKRSRIVLPTPGPARKAAVPVKPARPRDEALEQVMAEMAATEIAGDESAG
jgi:RNA-binding protein